MASVEAPLPANEPLATNGDLFALRRAALSSKKRKRSPTAEREEGELEEGEIEDDSPPTNGISASSRLAGPPFGQLPIAAPPAGAYKPTGVVPTGPRRLPDKPKFPVEKPHVAPIQRAPARPPVPPTPVVRIAPPITPPTAAPTIVAPPLFTNQLPSREPCRDAIKDLVSYGVTPEYLVGYGVAKETVALAFVELGYRLPSNLAHLAQPAANAIRRAREEAAASASPPLASASTEIVSPQHPTKETIDHPVLQNINVKQQIQPAAEFADIEKERREQLMERRKQRVAVEASIDTLFASAAAAPSEDSPVEAIEVDAQTLGDVRASVSAQDEINAVPTDGPFPRTAASRPHAVDFESDPTHTAAAFRNPVPTNGFVPPPSLHRLQQLVVDLSDDDDASGDDSEVAAALTPAQTAVAEAVHPEAVAQSPEVRRKLADKEAEILRMTSMIQRLEKRQRKGKAKTNEEPAISTVHPTAHSNASSTTLQEARDKINQLVGERQSIIDNAVAVEEAEETAKPSVVDEAMSGDTEAASIDYQPVDFTAYSSPFRLFPETREVPLPPAFDAAHRSLRSYVANHRRVEPKRKLCHFESDGGVCNDPDCKNVHFESFEPKQTDVFAWLKATFRSSTSAPEHLQVLTRGLDVLLERFSSPVPTLDLPSLYKEAYAFSRQIRPLPS